MNIFTSDIDPRKAALALDDKRVVKMLLESAQILSSAIFLNSGLQHPEIYRPGFLGHPCVIWASQTLGNWQWLYEHFLALCEEYQYRYGRTHKTLQIAPALKELSSWIPQKTEITPFANCARAEKLGIDFKHMQEVPQAYRLYLQARWANDRRIPTWTGRGAPQWYSEMLSAAKVEV
jgi:hypothetical protein